MTTSHVRFSYTTEGFSWSGIHHTPTQSPHGDIHRERTGFNTLGQAAVDAIRVMLVVGSR